MDAANGPGEDARHRDHLHLVRPLVLQWNSVGDQDPVDRTLIDAVHGRSGEYSVRSHDPHRQGTASEHELGGLHDGTSSSDLVVHDDRVQATDLADEVGGLGRVSVVVAAFVHHGDGQFEAVGEFANVLGFPHVASDQHTVIEIPVSLQVIAERGRSGEMVHRDAEEPLDLRGVQVHGEHSIGASRLEKIGHQARRDRDPGLVLLVGAGVGVAGQDHRDPLRRGVLESVDGEHHLDDVVADRRRHGLDVEDIATAHVLADLNHQVLVAELGGLARSELEVKMLTDGFGQIGVAAAGDDADVAVHEFLVLKEQWVGKTMRLHCLRTATILAVKY